MTKYKRIIKAIEKRIKSPVDAPIDRYSISDKKHISTKSQRMKSIKNKHNSAIQSKYGIKNRK